MYGSYEHVPILGAMDDHFLAVVGYLENGDVSTKSIVIFIIELYVWVIRACPNFIGVVRFFDSCRLLPQKLQRRGLVFERKLLLLWSVYDGLLMSVKNGLLWYMCHTSKCQICTHDDHNLTVVGYYGK